MAYKHSSSAVSALNNAARPPARHASDLGWKVDYCLDATLTWDMQQLDGRALCAADIKARTATVLQ
jgi:hypothetical protein